VGFNIFTTDGRSILDASCGAAVSIFGPGPNRRVLDAIERQRELGSYFCSYTFESKPPGLFARKLLSEAGGCFSQVTFYGSGRLNFQNSRVIKSDRAIGSDAIEAAIKLVVQYWREKGQNGRVGIAAREGSYHGATLGALSVGGHQGRRELFENVLMNNILRLSPCNSYRGKTKGESDTDYVVRLIEEFRTKVNLVGSENVAALILEPVVGAVSIRISQNFVNVLLLTHQALGAVPSLPGYLKGMREVCDDYGILFILDEVMCGMGRTGTLYAWQDEEVEPDIFVLGKGLAGGYEELSAMIISEKVVKPIKKGSGSFIHGHTFQNSPCGCAAGLEVLSILEDMGLLENVSELGEFLLDLLEKSIGDHEFVGNIRGKGLLIAVSRAISPCKLWLTQ
jgi:adenosylmethionine-8-amino-7-oxononanoate aminotransferase